VKSVDNLRKDAHLQVRKKLDKAAKNSRSPTFHPSWWKSGPLGPRNSSESSAGFSRGGSLQIKHFSAAWTIRVPRSSRILRRAGIPAADTIRILRHGPHHQTRPCKKREGGGIHRVDG
jgi:hypothetical protein